MRPLLVVSLLLISSVGWAEVGPRLINGKPADLKDWPSSVYASMNGSRCTATVVGERTLLIAAHCVGNGQSAAFSIGAEKYSSKCSQSPLYNGNSTADWAICLVDRKVENVPYELINNDNNRVKVGAQLTLTGYGCVNPGGSGGNDGTYRVGTSKVTKTPSGSSNDIVTEGNAALCFGDSGGPAFFVNDQTKERWVVGVNSRGNISTTSYLSSTSTTNAQKFINDWATSNNQQICGIHSGAKGCRMSVECDPKPFAYTGPGATISKGESIYLGSMPIPGQSYLWSPAAGLDYPNRSNPLATPAATTTYNLKVTNECGTAESSVTIRVL